MNRRVRVLPYKQGSKGAKALATALGGKVLKLVDSKFKSRASDIIINWGSSSSHPCLHGPMNVLIPTLVNDWEDVGNATNKLEFFHAMDGSNLTPEFWTKKEDISDEAFPIVCRTTLTGHSGAGIVIADAISDLVNAPLYTRYVKKQHEYRIHVGRGGELIGVQQKKRRLDHDNPNWKVRNHANGFIYAREGVNPPAKVISAAKETLEILDIDFGAVDVIWNESQSKAYVLEINTAPGLEGSTVDDYVTYFKKRFNL